MLGLSRQRVCWGSAGLVAVSTLAAYILTGTPSETPPIGVRYTPTAAAAVVDDVEPLDAATGAAVAAAADAVDAVGATLMSVGSFALFFVCLFGETVSDAVVGTLSKGRRRQRGGGGLKTYCVCTEYVSKCVEQRFAASCRRYGWSAFETPC